MQLYRSKKYPYENTLDLKISVQKNKSRIFVGSFVSPKFLCKAIFLKAK
jgi:hypothetical protein